MGEIATPVCFELGQAPETRSAQIAQEIAARLPRIDGVDRVEIAGGGYVNLYFCAREFLAAALEAMRKPTQGAAADAPKLSSSTPTSIPIKPRTSATCAMRRWAIRSSACCARRARVEVQNYIDNTGVQVADVVIGFRYLEKKTRRKSRAARRAPRFDYHCWDVYARISAYYKDHPDATAWRARNAAQPSKRARAT